MQEGLVKQSNVFRNRNFVLLFWGSFVSNIGNVFYSFAVSFYILEITNNNALIQGIYLAVAGVVNLIVSPIGGVMADKFNKVKIVYLTDFIRGLSILASGVAIFLFADDSNTQLIVLFVAMIVLNINQGIFGPSSSSLLRFIVPDEQFQQASSYFSSSQSIQGIIGVLFGGIFYASFGIFWVFVLDGASFILSAISEMFIKNKHTPTKEFTMKIFFDDMKLGIKYIANSKLLKSIMVIALGLNFFVNPLFSNGLPFFFKTELTEGNYLFSGFLTGEMWYVIGDIAFSIGSLVTALVLSRKATKAMYGKDIRQAIIELAIIIGLYALLYFVLVKWTNLLNVYLITMTVLMLLMGASLIRVNIPLSVSLMKHIDKDMLGKVNSISSVMSQALIPFASIIGGLLISGLGLYSLFVFSAVGFVIMSIYAASNKVFATF